MRHSSLEVHSETGPMGNNGWVTRECLAIINVSISSQEGLLSTEQKNSFPMFSCLNVTQIPNHANHLNILGKMRKKNESLWQHPESELRCHGDRWHRQSKKKRKKEKERKNFSLAFAYIAFQNYLFQRCWNFSVNPLILNLVAVIKNWCHYGKHC